MNDEKVKIQMDTNAWYRKAPANYYNDIKERVQSEDMICNMTLEDIMKHIECAHAISPGIIIGGQKASNWVEQSLFIVEIYNEYEDIPKFTIRDAHIICKRKNIMSVFSYDDFDIDYSNPRFFVAFLMDKPITDINLRYKIISTLASLFPKVERSCIDADKIFLGTNKIVYKDELKARITIDSVLSLADAETIDNDNIDDKSLKELIKNFDLLEYIKKENEVLSSTNSITYFENCSLCGCERTLRYYHKSNTFYCISPTGNVGGTIIDYLMYADNLTLDAAINKFKNELCNLDSNETNINTNKGQTIITDTIITHSEYFSAEELQNMDLPPVKFYVDALIPQGLTLICSVPKLGKSWFALQLCLAITSGQEFLGFNTEKCSCLYLALEDSKNRLRDRTMKLLGESVFPKNLYFSIDNKSIGNGLIEELTNYINLNNDIKVIVIDTLQKVRDISKTTNVYANDYKELSKLKLFADKNSIAIILIHHLQKGIQTNDVFDRVSGTNGITGTADTTIVLSKEDRTDADTKLTITGRDVEQNEYIINFDRDTCRWNMKGVAELVNKFIDRQVYNNNTLIKTIKELVETSDNNEWKGTITELNEEHQKKYGRLYDSEVVKLKKDVDKMQSRLLEYDGIIYIPPKYANNGKRIQIFKKQV